MNRLEALDEVGRKYKQNVVNLAYYSQERTSATKGDWNTAVGICPRMAIAKRNMTLHRQARIDVNAKITNR